MNSGPIYHHWLPLPKNAPAWFVILLRSIEMAQKRVFFLVQKHFDSYSGQPGKDHMPNAYNAIAHDVCAGTWHLS